MLVEMVDSGDDLAISGERETWLRVLSTTGSKWEDVKAQAFGPDPVELSPIATYMNNHFESEGDDLDGYSVEDWYILRSADIEALGAVA